MRRRWKVLVAVGAVALVAGLFFLVPGRDDGLDWIREYGAVERVSHPGVITKFDSLGAEILSEAPDIRAGYLQHDFVFKEIPEEVVEHAKAMHGRHVGDMWLSSIDRPSKTISFQREVHLNWWERQWTGIKRALGFK